MNVDAPMALPCPMPSMNLAKVTLAHGGGGTLMHRLIDELFLSRLAANPGAVQTDSAVVTVGRNRLAFTTDSFVVRPVFFPGGNIGSLAVHGTVNDLSMSGARPLFLSAGFILEEGFSLADLERIVDSMAQAARAAGVSVVTGDTKVVERGKGDGVYINTSGVGVIEHGLDISPRSIADGDVILVSGDIGRHGMAVMAQREGLEFETLIDSDSAALNGVVQALLSAGIEVHCMRDLTRGGLASALNELATASGTHFDIDERAIPVRDDVRSVCEILGFDPLYVACEGRFTAIVPEKQVDDALSVMQATPVGAGAGRIGTVTKNDKPMVVIKTTIGSSRIVDMLSGEQLPRIC